MASSVNRKDNSRYCGVLHIRTLVLSIAVLEIAFLIYQGLIAISFLFSSSSSHHAFSATVYTLAVLVAWIAVGLLLFGIFCQIPALLVPHMLMQVLLVLTLLGMASFAVYAVFVGTSLQVKIAVVGAEDEQTLQDYLAALQVNLSLVSSFLTGLLVLFTVGYYIAALINIWCFHVVLNCYRWLGFQLEEKSRALKRKDILISSVDAKPVTVVHATDF